MSENENLINDELKDLSERDLERYERQIRIFDEDGQKSLKNSTVAVIGLGGLGSPISFYLAAAGVGNLLIVDPEGIELSNLNRQILHGENDIEEDKPKTDSAKETLQKLNSDIDIYKLEGRIDEKTIEKIRGVDVIVDGLDNFETRYLLNEFAVEEDITLVHAAVEGTYGQLTTIVPGETPCLRCLFPEHPDEDGSLPILGTTAGLFGVMEANEVIKIITDHGEPLEGKLFTFDLAVNSINVQEIKRNEDCPVCSDKFE